MKNFPNQSHFSPTSLFEDTTEKPNMMAFLRRTSGPIGGPSPEQRKEQKRLEDWAHRVANAADEAGDNRLLALESDLLDLRDEIVHHLHTLLSS